MQNLVLEEGDIVVVRSATLPKGTFVKLQPHTQVKPHMPAALTISPLLDCCLDEKRDKNRSHLSALDNKKRLAATSRKRIEFCFYHVGFN